MIVRYSDLLCITILLTLQADLYLNQDGRDQELYICEQAELGEDQYPFLDDCVQQQKNHIDDYSILGSCKPQKKNNLVDYSILDSCEQQQKNHIKGFSMLDSCVQQQKNHNKDYSILDSCKQQQKNHIKDFAILDSCEHQQRNHLEDYSILESCEQQQKNHLGDYSILDSCEQQQKNHLEDFSMLDSVNLQIDQVFSLQDLPDEIQFSDQESDFITSNLPADAFKPAFQKCKELKNFHQQSYDDTSVDIKVLPDQDHIFFPKQDIISELENFDGSTDDDDLQNLFEDNSVHDLCENNSVNDLLNFCKIKSEIEDMQNFELNENFEFVDDNDFKAAGNFLKFIVL